MGLDLFLELRGVLFYKRVSDFQVSSVDFNFKTWVAYDIVTVCVDFFATGIGIPFARVRNVYV